MLPLPAPQSTCDSDKDSPSNAKNGQNDVSFLILVLWQSRSHCPGTTCMKIHGFGNRAASTAVTEPRQIRKPVLTSSE